MGEIDPTVVDYPIPLKQEDLEPRTFENTGQHTAVRVVIPRRSIRKPRILLVQRSPYDSRPLQWEPPGGAVDDGESLVEAGQRETKEETDLSVAAFTYMLGHRTYKSSSHKRIHEFVLLAGGYSGRPSVGHNNDHIAVKWASKWDIANLEMDDGMREFLGGVFDMWPKVVRTRRAALLTSWFICRPRMPVLRKAKLSR